MTDIAEEQKYNATHKSHCYQGDYEGSCKYGDRNCPAKPVKESLDTLWSILDDDRGFHHREELQIVLEHVTTPIVNDFGDITEERADKIELQNALIRMQVWQLELAEVNIFRRDEYIKELEEALKFYAEPHDIPVSESLAVIALAKRKELLEEDDE